MRLLLFCRQKMNKRHLWISKKLWFSFYILNLFFFSIIITIINILTTENCCFLWFCIYELFLFHFHNSKKRIGQFHCVVAFKLIKWGFQRFMNRSLIEWSHDKCEWSINSIYIHQFLRVLATAWTMTKRNMEFDKIWKNKGVYETQCRKNKRNFTIIFCICFITLTLLSTMNVEH